ncbi:MAG: V-type ATP synthase subunit B [Calditrichaeota bacterium]|jgi:V/A-type H+/Na+-transporting ATPase subunit B|nr:V-type ATP synthase subunit B [Calditrichota bacterium]
MTENRKIEKLFTKEHRTVTQIRGPLIFVERVSNVAFDEMVEVVDPSGNIRVGRVLEVDNDVAIIQLFLSTDGLDISKTKVRFSGDVVRLNVSHSMMGRILNGLGEPIDGGPAIIPEKREDINGMPLNPAVRIEPSEFIQTGISAIDGLNSLARGQKLPIFSGSGLPGNELAAQIASQARVIGENKEKDDPFAVVFAAIGITHRESSFFIEHFRSSGSLDRTVVFLNHADDPTIERIITPRAALTAAEYLAYEHGLQVLVILTDITNYCEALRELSVAREELPARRGYPGYMYSDLASLYERAGRIDGHQGSVTQLILLSMPDDDITHPIPDLTGYITEGQIVLNRTLHQKGIIPPINVLPSLSRLMNAAIGKGHTREDHRTVADQIYAFYAEGRDLEKLVTIIGEGSLTEHDSKVLNFSKRFENEYIGQGLENRSIQETLDLSWELLSEMPDSYLKRIPEEYIQKYKKRK